MKSTNQNNSISVPDNIVFYDDTCMLCKKIVSSIKAKDAGNKLLFKPLRLSEYRHMNSIVFKDRSMLYNKTDAVLKIISLLKIYTPLKILLKLAPRKFRDLVYDLIARHRNKFFATN